ncbi:TadE family protein [Qipengyuania atrilutea]|uniref:Pilus assembly protein n=1 Tax=Qipengyuania atrilutea TaxID=2744473 RepID=A0A850H1P5_9SPHN|nr:TadE family protein [Actirhodobacter atriluteus]NVD43848.1 pilus assembly protein [Actirhodobacter atriluteus]
MRLPQKSKRLLRDSSGATAIEFALLAPAFLMLFIGVLLVGVYMQNHNAVRSVAADTARQVAVAYQRGNDLNDNEVRAIARGIAVSPPYLLKNNRFQVESTPEATSRVTGAKEIRIDLSYAMNDFLPFVDMDSFALQYSRPIFVVPPSAPATEAEVTTGA